MRDFATLTLVCCLISISVIKHAGAQSCSQLTTCTSALTTAIGGAGQDISKLCSAYNTYLDCLNKAASACGVDISATVQTAKTSLSQYGCGSTPGASSSSTPGSSSTQGGSSTSGGGSMMTLLSWLSLTLGVFLQQLF